ncbi:MAG: M2 family metallopeptidase [Acidobacteriota bacterium]|nr:M2 family metallopeptidase [Acidobacteriota bacterium]
MYRLHRCNRAKACILALLSIISPLFSADTYPKTPDGARAFMEAVEADLMQIFTEDARAGWVNANFITHDTQILASKATEKTVSTIVRYAKESTRFDGVKMPDDLARKFKALKNSTAMPTPGDPKLAAELAQIVTRMTGTYGKGKYTPPGSNPLDLGDLSEILAEHKDPEQMLMAWEGWRTVSPAIRKDYQRFVELANQGARELGFKNLAEMWCGKYDMPPEEFPKELDRLWEQVKPLYISLHAYVRNKLRDHYGAEVVPADGPIPAHLLGNMWSQQWSNIYDLVSPGDADPGYDLTQILKDRKMDAIQMVKVGERFFTSLGFEPLPATFWERSLFVQPKDRDVVCHASAWSIDFKDDLRIKMCIKINADDFSTIHHELGHNFYQRAYNHQPLFFQESANDGFHEAVGDTLSLSITPNYLKDLGYIDAVPDPSKDIGLLLNQALDKIAFLPFGLLIDQWRWKVFSGEVTPENYNKAWWELRKKYQGIMPPVKRTEEHFDPAAKYHVAANVPYTRYFLAHILQFQFHRSLAEAAGNEGPLHRASIYGSKKAGKILADMLAMGSSQPWPEALYAISGTRQMDAGAILDYFAPLKEWLDKQNEGRPVGW